MIESFGARLRHERERRKIALKSIAEGTNIGIALLEGLERDNVSRWPSGIFRKSFIRAYAEAIGLDPEPIVREFLERHRDSFETEASPAPTGTSPSSANEKARFGSWPAALARGFALSLTLPDSLRQPRPIVFKITILSSPSPFSRGRLVANLRRRWAAAACDAGMSFAIALGLFPAFGHFWASLGVSTLCYYFAGILVLGNTPGVCLAAAPSDHGRTESR